MVFLVNEPTDEDFEGFRVTVEKKMIASLVSYTQSLSDESVNKLQEADIEEMLNIENNAPVVHSLTDGKIAVLNTDKCEDSSDDHDVGDFVNTVENVPIDNMVKMFDELIAGLEQSSFISEQEIMAIY
ncbi:hypothetical protein chiPu_0001743 [Chiloscyllium punctatum]|uniref:Uncharacterized protein n=1 Tax=Chiloscyllium punctatum TaxID=137246 RepID=A0A401RZ12_CHIPU|nr:hypothetical protein [Chiloscyllium punctatum]